MADERVHLCGDYTLDTARGFLLRSGEPVHLRPQAFEVLRHLAEHRGRLVTKDALIHHVWHGRAVTDDSLVQCLRDVRHALGEDASHCLRTIRGRGYILDIGSAERPDVSQPSTIRAEHLDVVRLVVEEREDDPNEFTATDTARVARRPASGRVNRRRIATAGVLAAACVVAVSAYWVGGHSVVRRPIASVAVLPLESVGPTGSIEYLSDGITDSLINSLSKLPNVSVKARSSVFRFKGREVEPQRVAADLGVQAVLNGRIVQRDNDLTIYLSLVDARNGNQLWGDEYHRPLSDLVSLQHEITRDVLRNLRLHLSGADEQTVAQSSTASGEAYRQYLMGRYHHFKSTEPEIRTAIKYFQQAIDADPTYARAYAGLADSYRTLPIVSPVPSSEGYPQAKTAAARALAIDPNLADAHVVLGWTGFSFDWNWAAAEREFQTAIALSPNNSDARRAYAHLLSNLGQHNRAIAESRIASDLDPLSLITNALHGQFLFYAGKDDEAEIRFRKTLELEPDYWVAHNGLGRVYLHRRRFDDAIVAFQRARALSRGGTESATQLGYTLARSGRRREAETLLNDLRTLAVNEYVPAYSFAMIHNGLGDTDAALRYLEQSFRQREVQLTFIKVDTRWNDLRDNPRFRAIAERMRLD
jgi:TolB-like protein/DNA-binding winged helix-turn-helix (wHTH) protein/Flp pilus assembly protein TadD